MLNLTQESYRAGQMLRPNPLTFQAAAIAPYPGSVSWFPPVNRSEHANNGVSCMRSFVERGIVSSAKGVTVNVGAEANKPVSRGDRRGHQGG